MNITITRSQLVKTVKKAIHEFKLMEYYNECFEDGRTFTTNGIVQEFDAESKVFFDEKSNKKPVLALYYEKPPKKAQKKAKKKKNVGEKIFRFFKIVAVALLVPAVLLIIIRFIIL